MTAILAICELSPHRTTIHWMHTNLGQTVYFHVRPHAPSALAPCSSPITEAEQSKRRRSQLADRISNKLHALFWVVVGATVVYRTDFVRVLMEDERVNR